MTGSAVCPILVLAVGNPSRGDDALGTCLLEQAERELQAEVQAGHVEFLTDFQLQIEHALDLRGRRLVVFADASLSDESPFGFRRLHPERDQSYSSHALSAEAVLDTYRGLFGPPPPAWMLGIRGESFELFEDLSALARQNLQAALRFLCAEVRWQIHAVGRRLEIAGIVQGVGFRPWLCNTAVQLGLRGQVWNSPRGVVVEAVGAAQQLDALAEAILHGAPAAARVEQVRAQDIPWFPAELFEISASQTEGAPLMTVPPDLGLCADCAADIADPSNRHFDYAFTSCTACGPRYSVVDALPYDRSCTSMAPFALCPACARDYADPADRRFHAQAIACPQCGPRLWLVDPQGQPIVAAHPLHEAAKRLLRGEILAIQGLGGFHLACDATNSQAVARLRRLKHRDTKPLAVMVAGLAEAEQLAELSSPLRAELAGTSRPIVLGKLRSDTRAPSVGKGGSVGSAVTAGSRRIGLMLPYTPLHHLLLTRVGRPLVMTSGNGSGEPIATSHAEALSDLAPLVDALLLHDRPIRRRVEDSVVAETAGQVRVLRRARGYAPVSIRMPFAAPEPVLAVGGHLKNAACLVVGDRAWLTPHLGDLGSAAAERAFVREVEGFEQLLGVRADVLACDLHPDYASTRYAQERPARLCVGVQHHVAHVLAAAVEYGETGPLLGVAFDGTGWGPDGTAWGGEFLAVDGLAWSRPATLRALPLPGGELAIRQVWRTAAAAVHAAFGEESAEICRRLAVFSDVPAANLAVIQRMLHTGVHCPHARGLGRWFDAVGALLLGMPVSGHEGAVAMALEELAENPALAEPYPVVLPTSLALARTATAENELDLTPAVRAVVLDLLARTAPARIAARFHRTVVDATAATVALAQAATPAAAVVLCGGSLQNRWLAEGLLQALGDRRVLLPRCLPAGDGGLALGQAWAAMLTLRTSKDTENGEVSSCV